MGAIRESNGRYLPGTSGGPGRPPCGRTQALNLVDWICGQEANLEKLKASMQAEFDRDPMKFFKDIVMPLAPKNVTEGLVGGVAKTPAEVCEEMDVTTCGEME